MFFFKRVKWKFVYVALKINFTFPVFYILKLALVQIKSSFLFPNDALFIVIKLYFRRFLDSLIYIFVLF